MTADEIREKATASAETVRLEMEAGNYFLHNLMGLRELNQILFEVAAQLADLNKELAFRRNLE